jgi:hypothetical protein
MTEPVAVELQLIAECCVREIAARTGFTVVATIGLDRYGCGIVSVQRYLPTDINHPDYEGILRHHAGWVRRDPPRVPVFACALVLPELDVVYVHYRDAERNPAQVITVGRNPTTDETIHAAATRGLRSVMSAVVDAQPEHRPIGRAFLAGPRAPVAELPPPPTPPSDEHRGRHRR